MSYKIVGARKRKPGAGRKPKLATIAKQLLVENKIDEAEASFAFLVAVRNNSNEPIAQRTAAAIWIYETVFGKSKQPLEISWREKAKELGYDPDAIIHKVATSIAEMGLGLGDSGSVTRAVKTDTANVEVRSEQSETPNV